MCSLYKKKISYILKQGEIETKIVKITTLLSWVHFLASKKRKSICKVNMEINKEVAR